MSVQIEPIQDQFKNADQETRRQFWEINVSRALNQCVSISELKIEIRKLNDQLRNYSPIGHSHSKESSLEINKVEPKVVQEVKQEVKSASWKELLIKLLQK